MRPHLSPPLQQLLLRVLLACAAHSTGALPRLCDVLQVLWEEQDQCLQELSREQTGDLGTEQPVPGCEGMWDNISCWPSSVPGRMVEVECPRFLRMLTSRNGSLFRNCTQDGWSETFPRPNLACGVNVNDSSNEKRHSYLLKLKVMYTVGYSSSLVMLLVALGILCAFRRLHCTRNYIHMHLFVSFILRALSNFIKDAVLFSSDDVAYCDAHRVLQPFLLLCGLLPDTFWKTLGAGTSMPTHPSGGSFVGLWPSPSWRLARSTLLLIPLFGIHYIVFAFSPEDAMEIQLFFELALGSFQGLVVAVLYCFLNGEVSSLGSPRYPGELLAIGFRVRRSYLGGVVGSGMERVRGSPGYGGRGLGQFFYKS
ncbi:PREDICTED: secretin receptor isoform X7 [Cercocebus atys]|uniref:secretin receptor isoform X7 n=1 Tax=Cercocebus atys TaxID=9531 RepID=UPI0005F4C92A|nr:PREDICTED: secretin receptor isoform X7 [Cercocebus atys]